ncbi:MARVEL domain-containing protein 2-like [Pseudonaja textilis]|uniref:MARVEL domain-containing protein 2-like n=1 Tax=Pseudonaja textilis TaxID=8673 RepID=UPI000EA92AF4|nr:MARVEL domain-containing protein 2-like [Pseudonaja textilis]
MALEKPLPAGAEGQPPVGLGPASWPLSSPLRLGAPGTPRPGCSSGSGSPPPSPRGPPHWSAQPAFPEEAPPQPLRSSLASSWRKAFGRGWRRPREEPPAAPLGPHSSGAPNPPPVRPGLETPERTSLTGGEEEKEEEEGGSTSSERKEGGQGPPSEATPSSKSGKGVSLSSHGEASTGPPGYREKLESCERKYGHLKSWPGLLRLLGALELLLGGMAFACTAAYVQKDYQWPQLYSSGFTGAGFGSYVPMTPFVLVVASLAWLLTVILLALGLTTHYRAILLGSHWWPLAEFALNLSMFLLYLAAGIAYVHDLNRGGLCYSAFAYGPLLTALCRVEGGQVAALTFLFLVPLLYLAGSLVCLQMWRHEAARRRRRLLPPPRPVFLPGASPEHLRIPPAKGRPAGRGSRRVAFSEEGGPEVLNHAIPVGHNPKPLIVPDYIVRYPAIGSPAEREKYTAIFKDQYVEYQALLREIHARRQRFQELEALMSRLPVRPQSKEEQSRLSAVWRAYRGKKEDPSFLEKQERCDYLRKKLSHLKAQIQTFDADWSEPSVAL